MSENILNTDHLNFLMHNSNGLKQSLIRKKNEKRTLCFNGWYRVDKPSNFDSHQSCITTHSTHLHCSRVDGDLWLFLESGESALAALSMDGISIGQGQELTVRLRTPDWMDTVGYGRDIGMEVEYGSASTNR